jgi:hypothetical protein
MGGLPTFRGLPACSCLVAWCPAFEAAVGREVRWLQLAGDAPASAGFHRGGGSADCAPLSEDELRIARNMGGAAWNRWWTNNYHAHIRLNGCPHNTIAQPQVDDLNEGRDGTGPLYDNTGTPDNGPRDGVHWPLRTWREGIAWAEQQEDDMEPNDLFRAEVPIAEGRTLQQLLWQMHKKSDRTEAKVDALTALVAQLATNSGQLTDAQIAEIKQAIADTTIDVDVNINQDGA